MATSSKPRLRLIHWHADEARERVKRLRDLGYSVVGGPVDPTTLRSIKQRPPAAVVIDLSRLPGQGRDVGLDLRRARATRRVPLIFVDGAREKIDRVKQVLPDATFTTWGRIASAIPRAIERAAKQDPVIPDSNLAGYSGTPLPKKLGLKPGLRVALVDAPTDFETTLLPLPDDVVLLRQLRGTCDLIIWFVESRRRLESRIAKIAPQVGPGGIWIAWPKQASGHPTDVTQQLVRKLGLAHDLVDFKICSIDETWSGLKFSRRRPE